MYKFQYGDNCSHRHREEFFIKAIAYQPEPLGIQMMPEGGFGGAGLCSVKMTPFGEWRSACIDSDYFDGGDDPERYPPGPNMWFSSLWERDFPIMKELGVNTIRLYNVNPTTREASVKFSQSGTGGVTKPYGKNHIPFMDYAHENGFKVIFPLVSDEEALTNDSKDELHQKMQNLIDEVGDHPALLMWSIGNELFLDDPSRRHLLDTINDMSEFTREYTMEKYSRRVPVTHCVVDIPTSYKFYVDNLKVDIFCANAGYRSDSLTDLFSGNPAQNFPGFTELSKTSGMPLFIGEIGWLSVNNSANYDNPGWFNKVWKDVVDHMDDGCIGGTYFEYSDELFKKDAPIDQTQLGLVSLIPYEKDGKSSAEDEDFFYPDVAVRKDIIFDSVKSGSVDGVPMNFNMDVFKYKNRRPAKYTGSPASRIGISSTFLLGSSIMLVLINII